MGNLILYKKVTYMNNLIIRYATITKITAKQVTISTGERFMKQSGRQIGNNKNFICGIK
jgi:hypothetical protein